MLGLRLPTASCVSCANKKGPLAAPFSDFALIVDQSFFQVWVRQIRPPATQPLIFSVLPDNDARPL